MDHNFVEGILNESEKTLKSRGSTMDHNSVHGKENGKMNTILKGSKLMGDIVVTSDIVLSGDVEGNITSQQDSNIIIKGSCKGNIETKGGNVDIEGEFLSGNITTGGNVSITGKFNGGEVKAKGKIYVNSEFKGRLEGDEIEIGAESHGTGELFYKEYIAVARGAKVKVQINSVQEDKKNVKSAPDKKIVDINPHVKEITQAR